MAGVTHINIQESVEELESLVRQQSNPLLKERLRRTLHDQESRYECVCDC